MITQIIIKFLDAKTNQEVNDIVNENLELLNANPRLYNFAKKAKKRINLIKREKSVSWKIYELN